jgi:hypothetical protein
MVGSDPTLVASVVPVVAFFALAFWLGLCFYAGSHPYWRHQQQPARQQELGSSGQTDALPPSAKQGLSGAAGQAPGARRAAHR